MGTDNERKSELDLNHECNTAVNRMTHTALLARSSKTFGKSLVMGAVRVNVSRPE